MKYWEAVFQKYFREENTLDNDASHDLTHFQRVASTAKKIALQESIPTDPLILLAAAYFHDVVSLPKNHPDCRISSNLAAAKAGEILTKMHFPAEKLPYVRHAIEAHSFSAGIQPETLEAKIIQDADRMEALGALGILRCFYVSGRLGREAYDPNDLLAKRRPLDDKNFGLDHFYVKLFKLPSLLQTEGGRKIASKRAEFLDFFVNELLSDIEKNSGGALFLVQACYQAGQKGLKLFHAENPFAHARSLDSKLFAIDKILEVQKKFPEFISLFLKQLREEIKIVS